MELYFSTNSKSKSKLFLLLLFIFFIVACNKKETMKKDSTLYHSDSIFLHHVLTNHIKYSRKVKDIPLKGINKSNLLIYRYCDETCDKCVEEDLQALLEIQAKIGKNAILVIPSFPENRNTQIRLRNELKDFNYINITEKDDMPLDEYTGLALRYFIFYPKEQNSSYIFFPTKGQQRLTKSFFNITLEEFSN